MARPSDPPLDPACLSLRWAHALLSGMLDAGVRELVFSPGSRSTPVVLAAERLPELRLTPVVDERSAAFLALGTARAGRRPVALLCTSGSAPAHWHPAVVEAHEWGVPLILLSADRPPDLIGWGANQTTRQQSLFSGHLRAFHDPGLPRPQGLKTLFALGRRVADECRWPTPGPVHLNLPFDEPLVPRGDCGPLSTPPLTDPDHAVPALVPSDDLLARLRERLGHGRGLILCGPMDADPALLPALLALQPHLDAPILADPLSGLRHGSPQALPLITRYDALLHNPALAAALRPDWVLRFGRPPVSRRLLEWLEGVPLLPVDPQRRWADPTHDGVLTTPATPAMLCDQLRECLPRTESRQWRDLWLRAEARCSAIASEHLDRSGWFEGPLIRELLALLPEDAALLVGNSLPIRQFDTWSGRTDRRLRLFGNRGVSGIDGQSSTLAGIAGATPHAAFGLIGDLSLFHDLGGLALLADTRATLLVIDNGGGRIFDYLPQRGLPGLAAHWHTPTRLRMRPLAEAFGIVHHRIEGGAELRRLLESPAHDPRLIEIKVDAEQSRYQTLAYWQGVEQDPILSGLAMPR